MTVPRSARDLRAYIDRAYLVRPPTRAELERFIAGDVESNLADLSARQAKAAPGGIDAGDQAAGDLRGFGLRLGFEFVRGQAADERQRQGASALQRFKAIFKGWRIRLFFHRPHRASERGARP